MARIIDDEGIGNEKPGKQAFASRGTATGKEQKSNRHHPKVCLAPLLQGYKRRSRPNLLDLMRTRFADGLYPAFSENPHTPIDNDKAVFGRF